MGAVRFVATLSDGDLHAGVKSWTALGGIPLKQTGELPFPYHSVPYVASVHDTTRKRC